MLHFWDAYWDLRVQECPCDVHFTDMLEEKGIRDATIFHFGTGGHHHLGLRIHEVGSNNAVWGITAAPAEYETYVKLAIEQPEVARLYKVFFGDIYQLDARLLSPFDVVTLFHLCEFRTEKNDAYGALTDRQVAEMLTDALKPGGYLVFYPGSFAWPTAKGIVAELAAERGLVEEGMFKSLLVYRKPA
jgi:hypothetical protein